MNSYVTNGLSHLYRVDESSFRDIRSIFGIFHISMKFIFKQTEWGGVTSCLRSIKRIPGLYGLNLRIISTFSSVTRDQVGHVTTKHVIGISDEVLYKLGCTATMGSGLKVACQPELKGALLSGYNIFFYKAYYGMLKPFVSAIKISTSTA